MNKLRLTLYVLSIFFTVTSCKEKKEIKFPKTNLENAGLIPIPSSITSTHKAFGLDEYSYISTSNDNEFTNIGEFLSKKIKHKTGLQLPITSTKNNGSVIYIHKRKLNTSSKKENYELAITRDSIILTANSAEAAFRGVQTIRQLIPEKSNDTLAEQKIWVVPAGKIIDEPNFSYRGSMLDVARHFFSVADVKKYIDIMAYYKFNILHLHLTDDQGWRIEIKSWPKLTEIGGSTEVGGKSGGFYTQEQYKDLVAYAAERYITIIPEVDMPGHTNAASVSYPFLNGNGKKLELYTGTNVGFSTFDTKKDTVYKFIDDVIREISEITPGPYFHIGGDESHVTKKEDFIYFINKVNKIVSKYGKQMIGWDEIVHADVNPTTIAQFWSKKENATLAADKNLQVILSPGKKAYLDMQYDKTSKFGLHWAGYIPIDTAYIWTPETYAEIPKKNILGIEAPLWSETISNIEELEYLAFPRLIGYSELAWSPKEKYNWEHYKQRLVKQVPYLDKMNVKFYHSPLIDWKKNNKQTQIKP